jgi:hypothetical protein
LEDRISEEECRGTRQILREHVGDPRRVCAKLLEGVDDGAGDGHDEETVHYFEEEEAGHEGEFDAGFTWDTFKVAEH